MQRRQKSAESKGKTAFPDESANGKKLFLTLLFLVGFASLSFANGILIDKSAGAKSSKPKFDVVAETVSVTIKNQVALTKLVQVFKNSGDSSTKASFSFPLGEKDTLIDFGLFKNSQPFVKPDYDSAGGEMLLPVSMESPSSTVSPSKGFETPVGPLAPGESLTVLLLYQSNLAGDGNTLRYLFPLQPTAGRVNAIASFVFYCSLEDQNRISEIKTEGYPLVVRGNGRRFKAYFSQENLRPQKNLGLFYRLSRNAKGSVP